MIIVVIASLILCCYWAYWAASWRKLDQLTAKLPVPSGLPIIGHATLFVGNTEKILKNLEDIAELAFKHQGVVKLWLGPKLYIAIGNAEDAQVVLENCLDKDSVYRFLRPWLGQGLFIAPLGLWKIHRRVLLPVFHNKVVEEYLKIISNQADVLLDRLSEQSGKTEFDVLRYITACTLDIVFETAMGERMDVQHSPDTPYLRARHTVMTILNKRLFKVWLQPDCLFNLTPYAKQQKENIELTHKFTDEVVRKRRLHYETNKNQNRQSVAEESYGFGSPRNTRPPAPHYKGINRAGISEQHLNGKIQAVLDMLFGREIDFTDEQLREHIDSITIAGNDTTALVVAYTLVLLGIHQDAQERAFQEQRSIFDNSKRGATKEDLLSMNYLERVIKESMRLYTVVPIIARNVDKEIYLPHSKVKIPAGVGAVVGAFAVHRSVDDWGSNANEFDPDRFLPERSADRHPAAFIPFSFGSRNCIGRNFGMIIIKSIISSIIRAYKIEANEVGPLKVEVLLFPIRGHQIKITKR